MLSCVIYINFPQHFYSHFLTAVFLFTNLSETYAFRSHVVSAVCISKHFNIFSESYFLFPHSFILSFHIIGCVL